MRTYNKSDCPNCGTALTFSDEAQAGDALVLDSDTAVKAGQKVTMCDACGVVVKAGGSAAKSKRKGTSKSSRKRSTSRKPQASKRDRKRSSRSGSSGR